MAIRKIKEGKVQCRLRTCLRHTSNEDGFCNRCRNLLNKSSFGELPGNIKPKKVEKKYKPKPKKVRKKVSEMNRIELYKYYDARLWEVTSRIVRLRDTNAVGFGTCIASNKSIWYLKKDGKILSNCDAGHYVTRAILSIKFDLNNVHAQGRKSNRFEGEDKAIFRKNLITKIGLVEVERIEKEHLSWGTNLVKTSPTLEELKNKLDIYKKIELDYLNKKNWS